DWIDVEPSVPCPLTSAPVWQRNARSPSEPTTRVSLPLSASHEKPVLQPSAVLPVEVTANAPAPLTLTENPVPPPHATLLRSARVWSPGRSEPRSTTPRLQRTNEQRSTVAAKSAGLTMSINTAAPVPMSSKWHENTVKFVFPLSWPFRIHTPRKQR